MVESSAHRIKQFEQKQMVFSAIGLLILLGVALIANSLHMQSVAEQSTKFISRMVQIGDFREVGLILQEARLDKFEVIHYKSPNPTRSFVLPPSSDILEKPSIWKSLSRETVVYPTINSLSSETPDEIAFEYSRFGLVPYAVLIWIILNFVSIPQTRFMKRRLLEQFKTDLDIERGLAKAELAREVRHNLRTPLAALIRIPARLPDSVKMDKDLLVSTIDQIKSLISTLDRDKRSEMSSINQSYEIYDSLKSALQEIALSIPPQVKFSYDVEDSLASALTAHIPFELRALLGNIVNNSVEALGAAGEVQFSAIDSGAEVLLAIKDNGHGIESTALTKVFEKGFSKQKLHGSGIGLYHAKKWIEAWGGRISIESTIGVQTTVKINLPIQERAKWYVPRLKLSRDTQVVVLDDQVTARHLWTQRLNELGIVDNLRVFASGQEVLALRERVKLDPEKYTFLLDFDLNEEQNGLDIFKEMPAGVGKYLVTGNFDQAMIRNECEQHEILLIPKSQISDLPIIVR